MLQLLEYERLVPEAIKLNATAAGLITKLLRREPAVTIDKDGPHRPTHDPPHNRP